MNAAAYIPFVILGIAILLALLGVVGPRLKKYRLVSPIKKVEPRKRHAKPKVKKRKSVWIKVI